MVIAKKKGDKKKVKKTYRSVYEKTTDPNKTYYYFAYGSNLWLDQIYRRCPSAFPLVGAYLPKWKLIFRENFSGNGVADIVYTDDPNDVVYGAIYTLSGKDLLQLDRYEGVPYVYDRITIELKWPTGDIFECITYKMDPLFKPAEPTAEYLGRILKGYRDWGFDTTELEAKFPKQATRFHLLEKYRWGEWYK